MFIFKLINKNNKLLLNRQKYSCGGGLVWGWNIFIDIWYKLFIFTSLINLLTV